MASRWRCACGKTFEPQWIIVSPGTRSASILCPECREIRGSLRGNGKAPLPIARVVSNKEAR